MKNFVLIVVLFFAAGLLNAQSHWSGYIVLNSGDTLAGEIKKPAASFLLHHQLTFRPKNEKDTYKFHPDELKGFKIGDDVYISHYIWEGEKLVKKFLRSRVTGYCSLYEYIFTTRSSRGIVSQPIKTFYVQRLSERLHHIDFRRLKNGRDNFFEDNEELTLDIHQGKYSKDDLAEIVIRYNRERPIVDRN